MLLKNKTVMVVGASSGIGRQVALLLGRQGNNVVITARRLDLLTSLAAEIEQSGSQCLLVAADALDAMQMQGAVTATVDKFGRIDAALLNIGDGPSLDMSKVSADDVITNMKINYETFVNGLMPLIEVMKAQNGGLIAQTNSLAGFLGLPTQGPYSAAKAAGRILMDASRIELAPWNIKFSTIYPGFIATERVAEDGIPAPFEISEQAAAKYIVYAMEKEKRDYLFPLPLRWAIRIGRILPKPVLGYLTKDMMDG